MAQDFAWLLAMHTQAQKFGDGLKPELVELLSSPVSARGTGVIAFHPKQVSSGAARSVSHEIIDTEPDVIAFPQATHRDDGSSQVDAAVGSNLDDGATV